MMKQRLHFLSRGALAIIILSALLLSSIFGISAQTEEYVSISGFDSATDILWKDNDINVTVDSSVSAGDGKSLAFNMNSRLNWKGFSVLMSETGLLADKEAIVFYLKAPKTGETQNFWFQIFYEYEGVQITHRGDFTVYTQDKGSTTWKETTYWNGYGPNIPYGFEGYVKIPLTGALKISYKQPSATDDTVKMEKVNKVLMFMSNFGGTNGTVNIDDMKCLEKSQDGGGLLPPEDDGKDIQVLLDFENKQVGESMKYSSSNPGGIANFTAGGRDFEAFISDKASADGTKSLMLNSIIQQEFAQVIMALPKPLKATTKSFIMYVKAPNYPSVTEFNYTFGALVTGGDYKLDNCEVYLLSRGTNEWVTDKYYADWGVNLKSGFEGYIQIPLESLIPAYSADANNPIPQKVVPENIESLSFWIHNFGGDVEDISALYFDAFYGNSGEYNSPEFFELVKSEFYDQVANQIQSFKGDVPLTEVDKTSDSYWDYSGESEIYEGAASPITRDDNRTGYGYAVILSVISLGALVLSAEQLRSNN